jgi:hypothetical protein
LFIFIFSRIHKKAAIKSLSYIRSLRVRTRSVK